MNSTPRPHPHPPLPYHTPSCDKSLFMQIGAIPVHWPVSGLNTGIAPRGATTALTVVGGGPGHFGQSYTKYYPLRVFESEVNAVRQGCDDFPSLLVLFNTRKRFYRCKWNFKVHTSTSCFFHCVRRNRSHTSQRRLMISLSSVTRGWKLSFNLLNNNYFYPPITGRSHSCI